jgi:hypothetical protein
MVEPDRPDRRREAPLEIDPEPAGLGRLAIWLERTRVARGKLEDARTRHASLDFGFNVAEHDAAIGGGLLAGALAYRFLRPPAADRPACSSPASGSTRTLRTRAPVRRPRRPACKG